MPSPSTRRPFAPRAVAVCLTLAMCLAAWPASADDGGDTDEDAIERHYPLASVLSDLMAPSVAEPDWIAEEALPPVDDEVRYRIVTRGDVDTDVEEFGDAIEYILDDPRGWRRAGVSFTRVESGPADLNVVLATPEGVASFGRPCSSRFSCRYGNNAAINEDRWLGATKAWNETDASLADYRRMVVNHEVGHWLGHGHEHCEGDGEPAPVMQQQSKDLQGCAPNPWPLDSELDVATP